MLNCVQVDRVRIDYNLQRVNPIYLLKGEVVTMLHARRIERLSATSWTNARRNGIHLYIETTPSFAQLIAMSLLLTPSRLWIILGSIRL